MIFSRDFRNRRIELDEVFSNFLQDNILLKALKCVITSHVMHCLGNCKSEDVITPQDRLVLVIPVFPKNLRDLNFSKRIPKVDHYLLQKVTKGLFE